MTPSTSFLSSSPTHLLFTPKLFILNTNLFLLHHLHHHHHHPKPKRLFSSTTSPKISFARLRPIRSDLQQTTPIPDLDQTHLPPKLQEIIALFQTVEDSKSKYHELLHYGSRLPPLHPRYKTDAHRVRGCVSQVWVRAFPDRKNPSVVQFEADSDSSLTKGLAALLVMGLSGSSPEAIAAVPPEFVHLLGLRQSLTPSRNNGFLNMLRLMQHKALHLDEEEDVGAKEVDKVASFVLPVPKDVTDDATEVEDEISNPVEEGERAGRIRGLLEKGLSPLELEIEDISYQHAGHAGVRGATTGGETHFNLRIVSQEFQGKSLVKRHRIVYELLQHELQNGLHALSIVAKTPSET